MFSHRRQLRRWAARLLLVWLFGVATGVANACAMGFSPGAEAVAAAAPSHHHDGDEGDHAKGNCHDFCQKASVTVPSAQSAPDKVTLAALPMFASIAPAPVPVGRTARSARSKGRVISQARRAGRVLPLGSKINLVVSRGRRA